MVILFYSFLFVLILLNTLSNRKSENKLYILVILLVWFLLVFVNDDYVDWSTYQGLFEKSTYIYYTKDIGFGVLCYILKSLGFKAISLRIVIYTIGLFLLDRSLRKINVNKLLFLALYCFYPVPSDAMHLRTCIVSYIFIYAIISYIIDKNWIKYLLLIAIAALFHKMAILYMPFVLINKVDKNNKFTKRSLTFIGVAVVLMGWNRALISWLSGILVNISKSVEMGNITNSIGAGIKNGWIIDWVVQLSFFAIIYFIRYYFKKTNSNNRHTIECIFWINVIALIFMPFYFISFDYFRLFRNMLAIEYMAFCIFIQGSPTKGVLIISVEKTLALIAAIFIVGMTGYMKVGFRDRASLEFYNFYYNDHISFIEYKETD